MAGFWISNVFLEAGPIDKAMIFNPIKLRDNGFNKEAIVFILGTKYDSSRPMGNVARQELGSVVAASLVGHCREVAPVIPRCLQWIDRAISEREEFGESIIYHQFNLNWSKAIGLWLSNASDSVETWERTRLLDLAARDEGSLYPKKQMPTLWLDDYMSFCHQSKRYEDGIAEFERYHGSKVISMKGTLKPREYGYALCLQEMRGEFEKIDLFEAGRKMLRANLQKDWLGRGQYIRAATWLKIVYWHHDQGFTPLQTILSAYDNMPDVPQPDFIVR